MSASIQVLDRGSYIEIVIGPGELPDSSQPDLGACVRMAMGKPFIVVWAASSDDLAFLRVFKFGVALAGLGRPIAIVASARNMEPARFAELVARNRGAQVRACGDLPSAKAWLGVG